MHVNRPENLADHEESSILVTVPPSTTSPSISPLKCGEVRDQITGMASKKDLLNRLEALA